MMFELKSRAERRARLFIGGTYFRAKKAGIEGNNISIVLIEDGDKGRLIVTNHNTYPAENVLGPVSVEFLEQKLRWNEGILIENLDTTPTARGYSISSQIAVAQYTWENLGEISFSRAIRIPGKLSAKLTLRPSGTLKNEVIHLTPRTKSYDLVRITRLAGPLETPVTESGWDISALRSAVASDPWIEMMPRGVDPHDDGQDLDFLDAFRDTHLKGGDGMPI
ncbi:hypothetical protein, partial [Acinetobacter sp.]|uniref:hypothetical protein n=1 Tax=Acinetobacter sp. TaxID=472 RepID=UPI00388F10D2